MICFHYPVSSSLCACVSTNLLAILTLIKFLDLQSTIIAANTINKCSWLISLTFHNHREAFSEKHFWSPMEWSTT